MTPLRIILDCTAQPSIDLSRPVLEARIGVVGAMPGGMQSGKPSVAIVAELPDGTQVFSETSLELFLAAAAAFRARYVDQ